MNKKLINIIGLGITIITIAVFSSLYLKRSYDNINLSNITMDNLKLRVEAAKTLTMGFGGLEGEIKTFDDRIRKLQKGLANNNGISLFLRESHYLAKKNKINLISIIPERRVVHTYYTSIPFSLKIDGRFSDVYNFILQMESTGNLARVETISLVRSDKSKKISVNLKVNLFSYAVWG